jgi:predicted ATPase/class 3 adenylate cyclase
VTPCPACGFENPAAARFCGGCGRELDRFCPSCGAEALPGASFCANCGTPLAAEPPPEPGEERKIVTALFLDVVGFTSRSEELDPEDVRRLLAPFYARARDELERFGGTVEKIAGDAVMALFGAPVAHEDDPERAVRAAFAIHGLREAMNADKPGRNLNVRIGVNTGEVVVALSARPSEGEWMAAGDVMNTAARLQAAAPVNGILVGEATYRAARDAIEFVEAEPVAAKGKSEPVPVWIAVAPRALPRAETPDRDSPLVGRGEELGLLRDALARARRERRPQLVTLVGLPGIGKSRMLFELRAAVDESGDAVAWLQGRSLPYGDGITFWALAEMAKAYAGVMENDDASAAEAKLHVAASELLPDEGEARWVAGHLRPLVGLADQVRLGYARSEAFSAWRRFFEAIAERMPLVLAFEDLHWADDGLLDFVDHLLEWLVDVPLLVVATTRPELLERRPGWGGGKREAVTVSLSALSDGETAELVGALLERLVLPGEVQAQLVAQAGGNPLYAGEYVRMLVDRGLLIRGGDGARLQTGESLPLPETVQGIIAARLDALPVDQKLLLHDAAVVGDVFWVGALAAIGSRARPVAEETLRALERKELVRRERRSSIDGEHQYSFRHVLVRDVAYAQLARARRAQKHVLAGEWLESLAGRSEDQAELVAHHYLSGLEYARASSQDVSPFSGPAARALRDAGDRAAALNAHGTAARFYATALDLMAPADEARPDVLFRLGKARFHAQQAGAEELATAREALLERGERERAAEADVMLSGLLTGQGERGRAREHLQRAAALLEGCAPSRTRVYVLTSVARLLMLAGEGEQAFRTARQALALAESLGLDDLRAQALVNIGVARVTGGDPDGADDLASGIEVARAANSPELARAYRMFASARLLLGDLASASELYAEARGAADRFGDAFEKRWLAVARAMELHAGGSWDEAARVAGEFVAAAESGSPHYMEAVARRVRGHVRLARGDLAAAVDDADRGAEAARIARDPWFLNPLLSFRARALLAAGRAAEAGEVVDELFAGWRTPGRTLMLSYEVADLAVVLDELGRGDELLELAAGVSTRTLWLDAAEALVRGDAGEAADVYAEIGSRPDEADARMRHARRLIEDGDAVAAAQELARALAFWRDAGAPGYAAEAEALAAASPRVV